MSTVTFDTLKFAKTLERGGVPQAQAEALAEAFREATSEELVTKDHLSAKLSEAKNDIIKWVAGMMIAQAGLIAALVKLL